MADELDLDDIDAVGAAAWLLFAELARTGDEAAVRVVDKLIGALAREAGITPDRLARWAAAPDEDMTEMASALRKRLDLVVQLRVADAHQKGEA